MDRREFLKFSAQTFIMASLCSLTLKSRAVSASATQPLAEWLKQVEDLASAIKRKEITPLQWQMEMERLLPNLVLVDFLKRIDFEALQKVAVLPEEGEMFQKIPFQKEDGSEMNFTFYRYLVGFRKGRSIPPHGHDNLVSSFVVLRGELHGRHFERMHDEGDQIAIQPTINQKFRPGDFSTVSEHKNNIHWFTALEDRSFIFDFGVSSLDPNWKPTPSTSRHKQMDGRVYLDIRRGVQHGEQYLVPRINADEAYRTYG